MNKTKGPPPADFDDNPEWTDETSAKARPADQVHPAHVVAALTKRPRGRPAGSDKERITIRLDHDVLERFRASGPGWQSRMNEALRKAVGV
ncbi:BrnA antitoxin family protein [Sphingomonas sp. ID0503]|uniref:BrnA antitoxin family protein n=1 Tax=Sphingomonas sp. ID0503 TaxID=3399691 RepID=UPI003AFB0C16